MKLSLFFMLIVAVSGVLAGPGHGAVPATGTIDPFSGKPCVLCHPSKARGPGLHGALEGNRCDPCHKLSNGNHQLDHRFSEVKDRTARLCYECHDDQTRQKSVHPPLRDRDCLSCHAPHASAQPRLLRVPLEQLCFTCHDRAMIGEEKTGRATAFRAGSRNLHFLHARQQAIPCLACHQPHAGSLDHLLRSGGKQGAATVTLTYQATTSGGSCSSSCHGAAEYRRTPEH